MQKRKDYISWDEYFMGLAILSAQRSKDPSTQVGACIVDQNNKILSVGYNGMPIGCSDDEFPWERDGKPEDTKYPYIVHAEMNAIFNASKNLQGSKVFVTLFPCNECAKAIIQSGIKEVIYLSNKYEGSTQNIAANKMFNASHIKLTKMEPNRKDIVLNFNMQ